MSRGVLLTGSHGFIGTNLIGKLDHPQTISSSDFDKDLNILIEKLRGVKVVIHLGALIKGTDEELEIANVINTSSLLEAISKVEEKPNLFIYASTFAVYGVQDSLITEETQVDPRNGYGKSKLAAEKVIAKFSKKTGIPSLILRFSNVYGPGMQPGRHSVVANFVYAVINGNPLVINGHGNQERDLVYIEDAANAILKGVSWKGKEGQSEIVNICIHKAVSLNKLAEIIEKLKGERLKINYPNPDAEEVGCWIGSNKKAEEMLGWKPRVSIQKGIKFTYEAAKK